MHFLLSNLFSCHFCMKWSFNLSLSMFLNVVTEHVMAKTDLARFSEIQNYSKYVLLMITNLVLKILNSCNLYNKE